jgi:ABC-type thiamine transport system ATPase subunit
MPLRMATVVAFMMFGIVFTLIAMIVEVKLHVGMMLSAEGFSMHISRHDNVSHGEQKGQKCNRDSKHKREHLTEKTGIAQKLERLKR